MKAPRPVGKHRKSKLDTARVKLNAQELPFLGRFVDWATGGNAFRAELFFVGTAAEVTPGMAASSSR